MPRQKKSVPTYAHHKPTGQAYVRFTAGGTRRTIYLGKFDSPESVAEYERIVAELRAGREPDAPAGSASAPIGTAPTVNELLLAFLTWAEGYYRRADGTPTNEIVELKNSARPVRELYGHTPAAAFGPKTLAAVRQRMIDNGLCRTLINRRIERVRRAFRWGTSEELIPVSVYESLRTLAGLRKGRSEVRESEPVGPVDPEHVSATLPYLDAHLRAMIELQRLTGMRPGEVCSLRFSEIDRTGDVWLYMPEQHKTAHRNRERVVPLGPKARAALVAFLLRNGTPPDGFAHIEPSDPDQRDARLVMADAYQEAGREWDAVLLRDVTRTVDVVAGCVVDPNAPLFSPAQAQAERFRTARKNRKSKVCPSQMNRRKAKPTRAPGVEFTGKVYGHRIRKAAIKAGVPNWAPNQLRHNFATMVRKAHGLEAAQVLLGHSRADVTQVYSERNLSLAVRIASEVG